MSDIDILQKNVDRLSYLVARLKLLNHEIYYALGIV